MSREVYVSFHHDRPARHPTRHTMLHRIEITETPEAPAAADSSIARFAPNVASLSRDVCGIVLKMHDGDEIVFGWPMVSEARNVPAKK